MADRWTPDRPLRLGTRTSALAVRQTELVQGALAALGVPSVAVPYDTLGDRRLDVALSALGAKGLFTAELEAGLRAGEVDACVHSLKDLPTTLPAGIDAVALLRREDPRDVLVGRAGRPVASLDALPVGARVGTCSLRRRAQLGAARPDLAIGDLRGNVGTRLRKLDEGQHDAILLAAAGLVRLGLAARIDGWLEPPGWLPAPGQGAVAVQTRSDDADLLALMGRLHDAPTGVATRAERALLRALEGGCQVPIGALVVGAEDGAPLLHGLVAALDGTRVLRGTEPVDAAAPERAGERLAARLVAEGAGAILDGARPGLRQAPPLPSP